MAEFRSTCLARIEHAIANLDDCTTSRTDQYILRTLTLFKKRTDIRICKADKNLGPVILSATQYHTLAMACLPPSSYSVIDRKNFIPNLIYARLRNILMNHGYLYEHNSSPPVLTKLATGILQGQSQIAEPGKTTGLGAFYILIKIHKPVIAGRPIVASYDSISYFASKYLDAVLQPFRKLLPSFLESSATLLPRLPTGPLPPGYSLMTADIVSLYPSIPHEFGLKATNFMLRKLCHEHAMTLDIPFIMELLSFVLKSNYFSYNDLVYHQDFGTAMGTPLAVAYADLTVAYIEFQLDLTPCELYVRYIDDIFIIAPTVFLLQYIGGFNAIESCIQLDAGIIGLDVPFLDMCVFTDADDRTLHTRLFQKPINQYLYIPPYSNHSPTVFKNLVQAELKRYRLICSRDSDFETAKSLFYQRLKARGYTTDFLAAHFDPSETPPRASLLAAVTTRSTATTTDKMIFVARIPNPEVRLPWHQLLAPTPLLTANATFTNLQATTTLCVGRTNYPAYGSFFISKNFKFKENEI
jgi:hypothetical protein